MNYSYVSHLNAGLHFKRKTNTRSRKTKPQGLSLLQEKQILKKNISKA